jgi:hypothetical protein
MDLHKWLNNAPSFNLPLYGSEGFPSLPSTPIAMAAGVYESRPWLDIERSYPAWMDNLPLQLLAASYYANESIWCLSQASEAHRDILEATYPDQLIMSCGEAYHPEGIKKISEHNESTEACVSTITDLYLYLVQLFAAFREGLVFFEQVEDEYTNIGNHLIVHGKNDFSFCNPHEIRTPGDGPYYDYMMHYSYSVTGCAFFLVRQCLQNLSRDHLGIGDCWNGEVSTESFSEAVKEHMHDLVELNHDESPWILYDRDACYITANICREFQAVVANRKLTNYKSGTMCEGIFSSRTQAEIAEEIKKVNKRRVGRQRKDEQNEEWARQFLQWVKDGGKEKSAAFFYGMGKKHFKRKKKNGEFSEPIEKGRLREVLSSAIKSLGRKEAESLLGEETKPGGWIDKQLKKRNNKTE